MGFHGVFPACVAEVEGRIYEPLHAGCPCCGGPGRCTVLFRLPSGLGLLILACGRALQCHAGFELGLLILAIGRVLLLPQPGVPRCA